MRYKKSIEIRITIDDIVGFFVDAHSNLNHILHEKFIGKCYDGHLIHDIDKIEEIIPLPYLHDDITRANILIRIMADVSRLVHNELIFVKVNNILQESGIAIGTFDGGYATVQTDNKLMLKKDTIVPAYVINAEHNTLHPGILALCKAYLPNEGVRNYQISDKIKEDVPMKDKIAEIVGDIKDKIPFIKFKEIDKIGKGKFAIYIAGQHAGEHTDAENYAYVSQEFADNELNISKINYANLADWQKDAPEYLLHIYKIK